MSTLIADPFEVEVGKDYDFVDDVLIPISKRPDIHPSKHDDTSIWADTRYGWIAMDRFKHIKSPRECYLGAVIRAKDDDLPHLVGPAGTTPLDLADDTGIGHHVAFLWDPERKMLWLQRDRNVVGKQLLADYFRDRAGIGVGITHLFRSDALSRARKLQEVTSVEFAYMPEPGAKPQGGIFGWLSQAEEYDYARIEVRITPRRAGKLGPKAKKIVKEVADEIDSGSGAIQKARVKGRLSPDDETVFVDMLRDRNEFSAPIPPSKVRDPNKLMATLRNIWSDYRDDV